MKANYNFESSIWRFISEDAVDLVKRMMCLDPSKRISLEGVLNHPWMTGSECDSPTYRRKLSLTKEDRVRDFNSY